MNFVLMIVVWAASGQVEHYSIAVDTAAQCIALGNTTIEEYKAIGVKVKAVCQKSFQI